MKTAIKMSRVVLGSILVFALLLPLGLYGCGASGSPGSESTSATEPKEAKVDFREVKSELAKRAVDADSEGSIDKEDSFARYVERSVIASESGDTLVLYTSRVNDPHFGYFRDNIICAANEILGLPEELSSSMFPIAVQDEAKTAQHGNIKVSWKYGCRQTEDEKNGLPFVLYQWSPADSAEEPVTFSSVGDKLLADAYVSDAPGAYSFIEKFHKVVVIRDGGNSLTLDSSAVSTFGSDYFFSHVIKETNEMLGLPESLWIKMGATNALSGIQTDQYNDIKITWSYSKKVMSVVYEYSA